MEENLLKNIDGTQLTFSSVSRSPGGDASAIWDGNTVTYDTLNINQYWEIDLGAVKNICRIRLYLKTVGVKIYVSSTGAFAGEEVYVLYIDNGGTYWQKSYNAWADYYVKPVTSGRYIRVVAEANSTQLAEIEAYEADESFASYSLTSDAPAFDGSSDSIEEIYRRLLWEGGINTPNQTIPFTTYIKLDLGAIYSLSKIKWYLSANSNQTIKVSENDSDWTTIVSSGVRNGWSEDNISQNARYILYDAISNSYLKEIEIYTPESVQVGDTLLLSDTIELNLSLDRQEETETLTLNDEINVAYLIQQASLDTISLGDDIDILLSKESLETITLADAINIYTVEPSVNDFNNIFSMVGEELSDVDNKISIIAENTSDVINDIRFLKSWQVAGDAGYQSLGKTYIKVYINSIEQTDAVIDSITISKIINGSHTASFNLGRPYDNTKPAQESEVEIKYHIWTLYKGYITKITPTASPDSITISCQGKHWKQNKTKKYFFVGHKPLDNQELYYNTISVGLSACGASFGIGNFIPQTMNLFGTGESDCITNLVSNSGNYGWFYDVDGSKKLWTAGQGDIINLERQEIGKNIGLYQVWRHQFRESIEGLINKFRVQMGDFVIRRFDNFGGSKEYAGSKYTQFNGSAFSVWNDTYERLASDDYNPETSTGNSGVFHHPVQENEVYKDVFVKYDLFGLNPELEEWTDRFPPQVIIDLPFIGDWKASYAPTTTVGFVQELTEGFTIDYEKGELIFNEPVYLYRTDSDGKMIDIKKPNIRLNLYKKQYYSNTEDPSDDPQSDISNPLMFFTDKMGDYPETIWGSLSLSGLSLQSGGWYKSGETDEGKPIYTYVPSWNDTAFAQDLANWRLSQNADKKISGVVDVSLDTICFYNIDLTKRIMIDEVIENPLNIESITYNIGSWAVSLNLRNGRYFRRSVSIPSHGE